MKIKYNNIITENDEIMFEYAKEFVFNGLNQKQVYDKLTLDLRRYKSKRYGISLVGLFEVHKENDFSPKIYLYDYGIKLLFNTYILSGYKCIKTLEQYRYHVLFHELAHLISTYNLEPVKYEEYINNRESIFDQNDEDNVNSMAIRFLLDKGVINDGGVLNDESDSEKKWWQLVLYRQ